MCFFSIIFVENINIKENFLKMKKLLTIVLALSMVASLSACGSKDIADTNKEDNTKIESNVEKEESQKEEEEKKDTTVSKNENKTDKKEENKTSEETKKPQNAATVQTPEAKPEEKPEESKPVTPEVTPEEKPETKPETKPEEKPQENTKSTVANVLLSSFKSKVNANSSIDVVTLANELVTNPVIKFGGGAMEVEPGYLTGFDNTEIKGFKKGAMFAPMIGTIPFVGYVFELEDGTNASSFISTLKASANLRWNICTTADEMVAGSAGNKVFFVMSSFSFDEE